MNYKDSVFFKRRSIRKFLPHPIEKEKIDLLVASLFQTETARNNMNWEIILVEDEMTKKNLATYHNSGGLFLNAPLMVIITSKEDIATSSTADYFEQDAGAGCHQLLLMAEHLGLGGLWCGISAGSEREKGFRTVLNIPPSVRVAACLLFGYKGEEKAPNDKYFAEKIHWEKW